MGSTSPRDQIWDHFSTIFGPLLTSPLLDPKGLPTMGSTLRSGPVTDHGNAGMDGSEGSASLWSVTRDRQNRQFPGFRSVLSTYDLYDQGVVRKWSFD